MRRYNAAFLMAALTVGCSDGLPSEEAPLDGSWHDEYGYDTSSWGWTFQRHADGVTYGGQYLYANPSEHFVAQIDTAWVTYPAILIRMVAGNCQHWGRCSLSGRFLSRNRIEIAGRRFQR